MNWSLKQQIIDTFGSQVDFAQAVNVNETIVSKVVRGRRTLPVEKQVEWAKALNRTPRELFGRESLNE